MFCVVAYDMPDDRRRTRFFKAMKGFGRHSQLSVFECDLHEHQYKRMLKLIQKIIRPAEDNVKVYRICSGCLKNIECFGQASVIVRPECVVI